MLVQTQGAVTWTTSHQIQHWQTDLVSSKFHSDSSEESTSDGSSASTEAWRGLHSGINSAQGNTTRPFCVGFHILSVPSSQNYWGIKVDLWSQCLINCDLFLAPKADYRLPRPLSAGWDSVMDFPICCPLRRFIGCVRHASRANVPPNHNAI